MSAKDIITVGLIRQVNEQVMRSGAKGSECGQPRSIFLDKPIANTVASDPETLNSTWGKVYGRLGNK